MNRMFLLAASLTFTCCLAGYYLLVKPVKMKSHEPPYPVIPSQLVRPWLVASARR